MDADAEADDVEAKLERAQRELRVPSSPVPESAELICGHAPRVEREFASHLCECRDSGAESARGRSRERQRRALRCVWLRVLGREDGRHEDTWWPLFGVLLCLL